MFKVKQKITKILVACLTALCAVVLAVGGIFAMPMPNTTVNAATTKVTFELGANGSASHNDGSSKTTYTETEGGYTLNITNGTSMYTGARDAKGNSCIKLGTSSKTGGFSFTVPDDVTEVVIAVAKYKANTSKVSINGTTYALTYSSDNGEYDKITVDTSSTKTVSLTTVSSSARAMVNSITFGIAVSGEATEIVNSLNTKDSFMNLSYTYKVTTSMEEVVTSAEATITFDSTEKRSEFSSTAQVWEENGITVTNNKAKSTNNVADYSNPARFYSGSTLTIEYPSITRIEFTCNTTSYASALGNSISGSTVSSKVVTVEFAEYMDSYTISLSGQVRMDSLTVYSAAGGEGEQKEVTTYSDSKFVIRCGIDAEVANIANIESFGICVSAGNNTVYYDSESAKSWTTDEENNVCYVVINLGDIINDTTKLSTEFTVQAYVVYDGETYVSDLSKTYSVASMVKEYKKNGENVDHLYDYLVSKNLIVEAEEEVA